MHTLLKQFELEQLNPKVQISHLKSCLIPLLPSCIDFTVSFHSTSQTAFLEGSTDTAQYGTEYFTTDTSSYC